MRIIELSPLDSQAAAAMVNYVSRVLYMQVTRVFHFQIGCHFMII